MMTNFPLPVPVAFGSFDELLRSLWWMIGFGANPSKHLRTHETEILAAIDSSNPMPGVFGFASSDPMPMMPLVNASAASSEVSLLMSAIGFGVVAHQLKDSAAGQLLIDGATSAVAEIVDDICPPNWPRLKFPRPGPPPWLVAAAQLGSFAESLPDGALRSRTLQVAGELLQKGFGVAPVTIAASAAR
jgi:hypothetical protein